MRIIIHTINYHPELTGIGKYTTEMCEWLAGQGHEVTVRFSTRLHTVLPEPCVFGRAGLRATIRVDRPVAAGFAPRLFGRTNPVQGLV